MPSSLVTLHIIGMAAIWLQYGCVPVVPFAERKTQSPYAPTPQISFDWKKGNLIIDAPGAVAFTGLIDCDGSEVRFQQGITLRAVSLINRPAVSAPSVRRTATSPFHCKPRTDNRWPLPALPRCPWSAPVLIPASAWVPGSPSLHSRSHRVPRRADHLCSSAASAPRCTLPSWPG